MLKVAMSGSFLANNMGLKNYLKKALLLIIKYPSCMSLNSISFFFFIKISLDTKLNRIIVFYAFF